MSRKWFSEKKSKLLQKGDRTDNWFLEMQRKEMQLLVAFDSNGFRNDEPRSFVKNIVCKHVLSGFEKSKHLVN